LWIFHQINVPQSAHPYNVFFLVSYGDVGDNIPAKIFCYLTVVYLSLLENVVVEVRNICFKRCIQQIFVCIFLMTETFIMMNSDWFLAFVTHFPTQMQCPGCFALCRQLHHAHVLPCVLKYLDIFNYPILGGTAFINKFVSEHCAVVSVSCLFVSALFKETNSMMNFLTSYDFTFITVMKMF
jgi:hypothetical protein